MLEDIVVVQTKDIAKVKEHIKQLYMVDIHRNTVEVYIVEDMMVFHKSDRMKNIVKVIEDMLNVMI